MKYAKFVMDQNLLKTYTKIINLYNTHFMVEICKDFILRIFFNFFFRFSPHLKHHFKSYFFD